jgi:hypothetical protein
MSDIVQEPTSEATPENVSHPPVTPEERFATIVEALLSNPDLKAPRAKAAGVLSGASTLLRFPS